MASLKRGAFAALEPTAYQMTFSPARLSRAACLDVFSNGYVELSAASESRALRVSRHR